MDRWQGMDNKMVTSAYRLEIMKAHGLYIDKLRLTNLTTALHDGLYVAWWVALAGASPKTTKGAQVGPSHFGEP